MKSPAATRTTRPDTALSTSKLTQRPLRPPDFESENRVLGILAQTLAGSPRSILQKLADETLALCSAHSAGISMLEKSDRGEPVIRWRALAGILAPHLGSTFTAGSSPCGAPLQLNSIQLMSHPVRHFAGIDAIVPGIDEILSVPFGSNGAPDGVIWVAAHDDTRRFDAEDARLLTSLGKFAAGARRALSALEGLEATLAERNAAADLEISAASGRDRFIAILGHELRGQLAPVQSAAELLKHEPRDTAVRWAAATIGRCVGDMTRLVDDLLGVARLRAGSIRLRRAATTVGEVIERSLEVVRPLVANRNHTLLVDLQPEPVFLEADVVWLTQALRNLVANAATHTDQGGRIGVKAQRDGQEVVIIVSDSGIGLAPSELEAIFELYAQAGSAGRNAGGLGIGLYVARLVIEAHGGSIRATSAGIGQGSEFVVRLPRTCPGTSRGPRRE